MRNFWLKRIEDESGVSGVGIVAEGTQFENGKCVLAWVTQFQSVAVYDSVEELERIHGKTLVVWAQPTPLALDLPYVTPQKFDRCQTCGTLLRVVFDPSANQ